MFTDSSTFVGHEGFKRKLQWNTYSCAVRSTQAILEYAARPASYARLVSELGTDENGTQISYVAAALRKRGFRVRSRHRLKISDLRNELAAGSFVMAYLDGDHVGVVYGYDRNYVYLADPSLYRAVFQRVGTRDFLRRWDRAALLIRA